MVHNYAYVLAKDFFDKYKKECDNCCNECGNHAKEAEDVILSAYAAGYKQGISDATGGGLGALD